VQFSGPHKFHKSAHCCSAQPAIILLNLIKDGLWKLVPIITLLTCIQDAFGFNLTEREYPGGFWWFSTFLPRKFCSSPSNYITTASFHVLPNLLLADYPVPNATQFELLSTRLDKKSQTNSIKPFKPRIKSHLLFAGIISSPFSPC
jgi:hypothetical protein